MSYSMLDKKEERLVDSLHLLKTQSVSYLKRIGSGKQGLISQDRERVFIYGLLQDLGT